MLDNILRIVAGLFGLILLGIGIRWQIDPAGAAAQIGMEVLEGVARSSQIGDLTAFFVVSGGFALWGVFTRNGAWMYAPAALVGLAALFRTLSWAVHGAPFAADLILPEVVMCVVFLLASKRMKPA